MEKRRILVVDDEEDLCEILRFNLNNAGFVTDTALSGEEAIVLLKNNYDLLLLDVMMSGISGFTLAELICKELKNDIPIIFITAREGISDRLKGFETGADDYIPKPFSVKEVIARVKAVLSRAEYYKKADSERREYEDKKKSSGQLSFGSLIINTETKQVTLCSSPVMLTKKEFEILYMLAKSPGRIFSREEILLAVWKNEVYVLERTVDVHIARLRKKLGEMGSAILNRSGYGYCFEINFKDEKN
ncbi:MAG: response regulator transcription factor [Bacteroidales bacterium]|nr:response regulator transcription factor [Bacteroidales bacterium]MDD3988770.1 response regulator transcription factor [Bacteroidales bacterium]MDD4638883.1 response regulator transcription factor [Bacteroidales bacterium]